VRASRRCLGLPVDFLVEELDAFGIRRPVEGNLLADQGTEGRAPALTDRIGRCLQHLKRQRSISFSGVWRFVPFLLADRSAYRQTLPHTRKIRQARSRHLMDDGS